MASSDLPRDRPERDQSIAEWLQHEKLRAAGFTAAQVETALFWRRRAERRGELAVRERGERDG